jgi:hypothetical protein
MIKHYYTAKLFVAFFIFFLFTNKVIPQNSPDILFEINPAKYDGVFTYLVFPFNETFIKKRMVKSISYVAENNDKKKGVFKHCYEFDINGHFIKEYGITIKEEIKQIDTVKYEERVYNLITGLPDTVIRFDNRPLLTNISCYHYDSQNRLESILYFGLTETKPLQTAYQKDPSIKNEFAGIPVLPEPRQEQTETANKSAINGRPVDASAFGIMRRTNDFSSIRYKYYLKDRFSVEEQTTLYDFSKRYDGTDTCKSKVYYYTYGNKIVMKMNQYDCVSRPYSSEFYIYKKELLDSIKSAGISKLKDVVFRYDKKSNLSGLTNIWSGKGVSDLEMIYDKKGLIKILRRKSFSSSIADYFMDNVLTFEYEFYK